MDLRRVCLAGVEALLEELTQLLPRREHVLVTRAARRQLDDPDVVVAHPVAAGIGCSLVERDEPGAATEAHSGGIPDLAPVGNRTADGASAKRPRPPAWVGGLKGRTPPGSRVLREIPKCMLRS